MDYWHFKVGTCTKPQNKLQDEFYNYVKKFDKCVFQGNQAFEQFKDHLTQMVSDLRAHHPNVSKFHPQVFINDYMKDTHFLHGDNFNASAEKVNRFYPGVQLEIDTPVIVDFSA